MGIHMECVDLFELNGDIEWNTTMLMRYATWGDATMVRNYLPKSRPRDKRSGALRNAAIEGHLEIVQLLLPHSDIEESAAIEGALQNDHLEVAQAIEAYLMKGGLVDALMIEEHQRNHSLLWTAVGELDEPIQRKARRM